MAKNESTVQVARDKAVMFEGTEALIRRLVAAPDVRVGIVTRNPIPTADGQVATVVDRRLSEWAPGDRGSISRIFPESTLLLDYLAAHDIKPGAPLTFDEIAPFNGPLLVTVQERSLALGREIAASIYVAT
jgi:Fe2+ transport system protein FeoA